MRKYLKKTFFLLVLMLVFAFLLQGEIALAEESEPVVEFKPQVSIGEGFVAGAGQEITGTTLANYIDNFYKWSIRAIAIIAVVMIMVAGFQWMTAGGNASLIGQAKKRMSSALMGLILVLGAQFLLNFINPSLTVFRSLDLQPVEREELAMATAMNACRPSCEENEICLFKGIGLKPECDKDEIGVMYGKTIKANGEVDQRGGYLYVDTDKSCGTLYCKKGPLGGTGAGFMEYALTFYIGNECESGECVIRDNQYNEKNPFVIDNNQWMTDEPVMIGQYAGAKCMDPYGWPYVGAFGTVYEWKCLELLDILGGKTEEKWVYDDSTCTLLIGPPIQCPDEDEQPYCLGSRPPWDGY